MEWFPEDEEEDILFSPALLARRASESWIDTSLPEEVVFFVFRFFIFFVKNFFLFFFFLECKYRCKFESKKVITRFSRITSSHGNHE